MLSLLFGQHEWSDHTYLTLVFFGIVVAAFEGEFLVKRFGRGQRDLIASIAEEQPKNMAILEAEQKKLNRQQIRNGILFEQIVASLPSASGPANDLE